MNVLLVALDASFVGVTALGNGTGDKYLACLCFVLAKAGECNGSSNDKIPRRCANVLAGQVMVTRIRRETQIFGCVVKQQR